MSAPQPKKQRRGKSFRGCTYCRANKKKCSEERPACAYCIRTGHASTCTYEGLQSLIRFEWCTAEPEEEPPRKKPSSPGPFLTITPPDSEVQTTSDSLTPSFLPSTPSTPTSHEYLSDTVEFSFPSPDDRISQLTEAARTEAFHLVHSWPLSNGTGFETPDLPYVHFFMNQMGNYLWFAGITQPVTRYIMAKALEQPVLQHAVLCTSAALLSERYDTIRGARRYLEHKQKCLGLLREHIDSLDINEGVAAAVFFLLFVEIGEMGARSHLRGLKSVLDYLKKKGAEDQKKAVVQGEEMSDPDKEKDKAMLNKSDFTNSDMTGISPLAWLIWAWGIRMDIGIATLDGQPMIAPLPVGPEQETFHRSWISSLSDPTIPDSAEWGLLNFTLDNIMHRGCHVARKARTIRSSPTYSPEVDEAKIHRLCQQLDNDLEQWRSNPILQQAKLEEEFHQLIAGPIPPECCFLHYPPAIVHNRIYCNLIEDYRTAKLYLSLVEYPSPGPNPPGSGRFQHAVEICRIIAAKPLWERDDVRGAEEAMCLFLAGVVFGVEEYYPMESRWVQNTFEQYFPTFTGSMRKEDLLGIWLENCPCVPMVREKNFPWTLLSSLGVSTDGLKV